MGVTNIETHADNAAMQFPEAHSVYWYDRKMYKSVVSAFLGQDLPSVIQTADQEKYRSLLGLMRAKNEVANGTPRTGTTYDHEAARR